MYSTHVLDLDQNIPTVSDVEDYGEEEDFIADVDARDDLGGADAGDFDLLLPSSPDVVRLQLSPQSLIQKESELRVAQLEIILRELRRLLRIKASV